MTSEEIIARLDGAKACGAGKWQAQCPAHEDRSPSLSISDGADGCVVLHCHAGCETEAVLGAIGLELTDLFPPKLEEPRSTATINYDYRNAHGDVVARKVRKPGKKFGQCQPKGGPPPDGRMPTEWVWNLTGITPVLFHLPELLAANPAKTVYVVEGEKDVLTLERLGLVATCCVGGSGKNAWWQSYSDALADRCVVVIADNDVPGEKHAKNVADRLRGYAKATRILRFPNLGKGADVTDYLESGGTRGGLLKLVREAFASDDTGDTPDGELNFSKSDDIPGDPVTETPKEGWMDRAAIVAKIRQHANDPLVEIGIGVHTIAKVRGGGTVTLTGPTGAGKTSLVAAMAMNHTKVGHVFMLSRELPSEELGARMIGAQTDSSWLDVLTGELDDDVMLAALPERFTVIARREATLDALDSMLAEYRKENSEDPVMAVVDYGQIMIEPTAEQRGAVAAVWERGDDICRRHNAVLLILSQMSRSSSKAARAGERFGAEAIDGGAETAAIERYSTVMLEIGVAGPMDSYGRCDVMLSVAKGRMGGGDMVIPCMFEGRTGRWGITGPPQSAAEVREEAKARVSGADTTTLDIAIIATLEKSDEQMTRTAVIQAAGGRKSAGLAAIKRLLATGAIVEVGFKKSRAPLWTPAKAKAAGLPIQKVEPIKPASVPGSVPTDGESDPSNVLHLPPKAPELPGLDGPPPTDGEPDED